MWYLLKSWGTGSTFLGAFDRVQNMLLLTEKSDIRQLRQFSTGKQSPSPDDADCRKLKKTTKAAAQIEKEMLNRCISMTSVSVMSNQPGTTILHNIDLYVPASKLTMVFGSAGCGKTTFLRTLLGEATATGIIEVSSFKIAYCAQTIWLPTGRLQDAIVADAELDRNRFSEVISACDLASDVTALDGAGFQIGSNGANLSASQKQKVALARALYSTHPIVICDDPLSAIDPVTAKGIFESVFSNNGMLKKQGRTALIATHERQWATSADQIILLSNEGNATVYRDREVMKWFDGSNGASTATSRVTQAPKPSDKQLLSAVLEYARQDEEKPASILDFSLYRYLLKSVPSPRIIWSLLLIVFNGIMESGSSKSNFICKGTN